SVVEHFLGKEEVPGSSPGVSSEDGTQPSEGGCHSTENQLHNPCNRLVTRIFLFRSNQSFRKPAATDPHKTTPPETKQPEK
ncbi:hypothetical protein, partial [Alistipes shahii]|uniref:hypothetical protein n=1 Tax=Alistipes shahii TaxID=328814 RepID=UPI003A83B81F